MYKNVASALKNIIDVGAVDADMQNYLKKRFEVRSYPSLYYFHGRNFTKFTGRRNVDEIVERGFDELRRKVVKNIETRQGKSVSDDVKCSD